MKNGKRLFRYFAAILVVSLVLSGLFPVVETQAATGKTVATQTELNAALKDTTVTKITIKTHKKLTFSVAKNSYTGKTLVVNAPNAIVNNKGAFQSVAIQGASVYSEQGINNIIRVTADSLTFNVPAGAKVGRLTLAAENGVYVVNVDGSLSDLRITKKADVILKGKTTETVTVRNIADGTSFISQVKTVVKNWNFMSVQFRTTAGAGSSVSTKGDISIKATVNVPLSFVSILENGLQVTIQSNAKVEKVNINKPANVVLSGKGSAVVNVLEEAVDAKVCASMPVKVKAAANISVILEKGAEDSTVTTTKEGVMVFLENKTIEPVDVKTPTATETVLAGASLEGGPEVNRFLIKSTLDYFATLIDDYYLEDVDSAALVSSTMEKVTDKTSKDEAVKMLIEGLGDPYSAYYTAPEYQNVTDSNSGNYCGIGATIQQDEETGGIRIVEPFRNGPAQKAGLMTNDIVLSIDGMSVIGMDLDTVVTYVKGEQGTPVVLEIQRGEEHKTITIYRDVVTVETVTWEMKEDQIGYIHISQFDAVTVEQFKIAVEELEKEGMKGLVIDLRNNPGGLLSAVSEILGQILPAGKLITYTEDKQGKRENLYAMDADQITVPMVVLVNGNSASASELFTGAVKDYGVATIVGENTFGKGIVQGFLTFTDGSSLKLTTSKYYTPNGVCIHKTGVLPDIVVKDDETTQEDEPLIEALKLLK